LEQEYLLSSQLVDELLDAAELKGTEEIKARFAARLHCRRALTHQHAACNPAAAEA